MEYVLLFLFGLFVVLAITCVKLVNRPNNKTTEFEELKSFLHTLNNNIHTKSDAMQFYSTICEMSEGVFKLNLTREEFEKLSVESIKKLNSDAIENLNF